MMQTTPSRSTPFNCSRVLARFAIAALALAGLSFTGSAEAARQDRAGIREQRQIQLVVKRVERLEQVSMRSIDRAPDATIRLLNLLVTRGAPAEDLEGIALRGSHKVAIERRKFEDQVRKYTDGLILAAATTYEDEDGMVIPPEFEQLTEGTLRDLRDRMVSEDLIAQVIDARQSAISAMQDAALVAEARIQAALDAALATP